MDEPCTACLWPARRRSAGDPIVLNPPCLRLGDAVTALVIDGSRECSRGSNAIVSAEPALVVFVSSFRAYMTHPTNWHPLVPASIGGAMSGAWILSYAFI